MRAQIVPMLLVSLLAFAAPAATPVRPASLDARVAALAGFKSIDSEGVGYAGTPSEAFAAADAVTTDLPHEAALRLLRHASPVVRGYVAAHLVEQDPDSLDDVAQLLSDATPV